MYVTTTYIGVERGRFHYLFFFVTESYIEANGRIADALQPLLSEFGKQLAEHGAVVKPFDGGASKTFEEVWNRRWSPAQHDQLRDSTPGLLVIDSDFRTFDPAKDPYLFVSFREAMDDFGNVKPFEIGGLLSALTDGARRGDIFDSFGEYMKANERTQAKSKAWNALELKPGIWGFKVDLKTASEALSQMRR